MADGSTIDSTVQSPPQHAHAVLHCNLNTADLARAQAFYTSAFGLTERMRTVGVDSDATAMGLGPRTQSVTSFLYDRRGPRVAPAIELVGWTDPAVTARPASGTVGLTAIGYRTPALQAVLDRVAADAGQQARPVEPVDGGLLVRGQSCPAARIVDPDGVTVEIIEIAASADEDSDPAAGSVISHERITCRDLDRSIDWYTSIGWQAQARGDGDGSGRWASLGLPADSSFSIELTEQPSAAGIDWINAATQGLYRMALAVEDVNRAHAELVSGGLSGLREPFFFPMPDTPTGGFTALFLHDPDGVVVELVERPRSALRRKV